jgi:CubicO group peptidase (beta-lactamase class C family)
VLLGLVVLVPFAGQRPHPGGAQRSRVTAADSSVFDSIVLSGIRQGAYPGAVLVIGRRDRILYEKGYGHFTWSARSPGDRPDSTLFDLASLTKAVATTTATMILVDRGKISLDAPVATYLPGFNGAGTASITVRMLLTHTSGLRGDLPVPELRALPDEAALVRAVLAETPRSTPGTRVVYSDLNFVLLGEILKRVSGEPLDQFVTREMIEPLGLTETRYRPAPRLAARTAPTGLWRGHPVAGVVNDPTAAKAGGVSGNAGLFSTGADLARFAQFLMRGGTRIDGGSVVAPATVKLFTTRSPQADVGPDHRALGWQAVPTDENVSSAGTLFGPHSFGHTGWTGTSLWIDPDRDVFVVLLTNRAFAPRARKPFTVLKEVRGRLADAAARESDRAR